MIEIKNVSKKFGKLQALDKLNLTLQQGECVALIGPNGCGKTTLIKSILGMVLPDEGEIIFNGKSIKHDINYRNEIGYMPQIGRYPENMTIGQVLELIKGIRDGHQETDKELYEQFLIATMLEKKMRTLSGGTTQKVSAVLAFLFRPKVLILDEPTAGLDPIAALILKDKILKAKEQGCLILITSHLLNELEDIVSEILFMQEGKLILHDSVDRLKELTGEDSIARSIVHLLKENGHV
ncbi:MAG TPA: ABC transporter ATP-binding protein [Saprospiraceae bacterium]|jgi:Cu-processing system ATP-binding protein|nr:MAG: copper ABC transporter ATP-binding protein [Candidatus Parvibacillus calidus]MBX2936821.1 ABC transporter ATP-binding protein [Saprospiraceae bacterium]MBK7739881.1 ABC transporter ATP-binding protein [Candidatus Parvibacillus calidus]MBX7179623.1 ABC transporter ATP-binding protein [Saprospiraceae bacterium]MCB0591678.1 ABC transporter ATP-binding protein [Saprospiraceae bacterium]